MQTAVGQVTVQRRPLQLSLMRSNDVDRLGGVMGEGAHGPLLCGGGVQTLIWA